MQLVHNSGRISYGLGQHYHPFDELSQGLGNIIILLCNISCYCLDETRQSLGPPDVVSFRQRVHARTSRDRRATTRLQKSQDTVQNVGSVVQPRRFGNESMRDSHGRDGPRRVAKEHRHCPKRWFGRSTSSFWQRVHTRRASVVVWMLKIDSRVKTMVRL